MASSGQNVPRRTPVLSSGQTRLFPVLVAAASLLAPPAAAAQSLLDRSPNVSGDWTGAPGPLYFNFVHRFSTSGIPLTPHTVSLQATNTLVTTLQGASRGTSDIRYGFEFTIPLTLRRYFGRRAEQQPEPDSASVVPAQADASLAPAQVAPEKPDSAVKTIDAVTSRVDSSSRTLARPPVAPKAAHPISLRENRTRAPSTTRRERCSHITAFHIRSWRGQSTSSRWSRAGPFNAPKEETAFSVAER